MNPLWIEIIKNNHSDIEAIVTKIGVGTLFSLLPNILNILKTVEDANKTK